MKPGSNAPPCSEIVRQLLIVQGAVTSVELNQPWPCFVSSMPDAPDNCVCIYDTNSQKLGRLHRGLEVIERPGIMVHVRAARYIDGFQQARKIEEIFDQVLRMTVDMGTDDGEFTIHSISRSGSIIPMGTEPESKKRRELFSLNVLLSFNPNQ